MVYHFSDHFLCLDHCYCRCLWLVEEVKRIYEFKLSHLFTSKTGCLIFEKLIEKTQDS
jgi:hypothetical protein